MNLFATEEHESCLFAREINKGKETLYPRVLEAPPNFDIYDGIAYVDLILLRYLGFLQRTGTTDFQ